jgi:tetratricopeptide (TPR) repeat protein
MERLFLVPAIVLSLTAAVPSFASTCPAAPNNVEALSQHLSALQDAENEMAARMIINQMWELWDDAPDEQAQAVLDRGMRMRSQFDLLSAVEQFDKLISYCPQYAEGYNQRAFANFLMGNFDVAIADLDRAIELSPAHIGAIVGRAMTLIALGREDDAQADLRRAVALNPWLPERGMLREEDPAKEL